MKKIVINSFNVCIDADYFKIIASNNGSLAWKSLIRLIKRANE